MNPQIPDLLSAASDQVQGRFFALSDLIGLSPAAFLEMLASRRPQSKLHIVSVSFDAFRRGFACISSLAARVRC